MHDERETPAPVGAPVTPLTVSTISAAPELDDEEQQQLAARVAGGLYLLVALTGLPMLFDSDMSSPFLNPFGLIIDFCVCAALLRGQLKIRGLAITRIVLGTVLYGVKSAADGDFASLVVQLFVFAFMLLLLIGVPSRRRRTIGAVIGVGVVVLSLIGVLFEYTSLRPTLVAGTLTPIEGGVLHGVDSDYALTLPAAFELRDTATARKENANADTWAIDERHDAHVLTVCIDLTRVVSEEAYVKAIVDELVAGGHPIEERSQPEGDGFKRWVRVKAGGPVSFLVDINARGDLGCVVYAFAMRARFNTTAMTEILDSFHFTTPLVAGGMHAPEGGVVVGHDVAYRYVAPARFQLRDRAAFADTNGTVDQWAVDPVLDQRIYTQCERAGPNMVFDMPLFFGSVVEDIKDDDETLEVLVPPTQGHARARLASTTNITLLDVRVRDDVACWAIAHLAPRQASSLPELVATLDTLALPSAP